MPISKLARIRIDKQDVDILNVPFSQQPPQMLCFPYSVKMIVDFYKCTESESISQRIPQIEAEQIIDVLNVDPERGVVLSATVIKKLNDLVDPIEFKMYVGNANIGRLDECYDNKTPPILIFDPMYYFQYREGGAAHATVYIGKTETKIITNNPWLGKFYIYDLGKFIESWEIEDFRMLVPSLKGISTELSNFFEIYEDEENDDGC